MKIFIDTADIEEIKEAISWGVVDGVTTNPSLIKKAVEKYKSKDMDAYIRDILKTAGKNRSVSLEVIGLTEDEMFEQAKKLYAKFNPVAGNVAIKIPVNPSPDEKTGTDFDGLKNISKLAKLGIPVNATLIMTPEQALLAAKAGASFVSPFAGRVDDALRTKAGVKFEKTDYYNEEGVEKDGEVLHDNGIVSGVLLVSSIVDIFENYDDIKTEVLAASTRNPRQVREIAEVGAHISTIPFSIIKQMVCHVQTYEGVRKFKADVVPEYEAVFK